MEQRAFARWLKVILIGVGLCGLAACALAAPMYGLSLTAQYPEFSNRFWPWLVFLWLTALPCFAALWLGWRIADNIGHDRSFCVENAAALKKITRLAAGDSLFFFLGNVALLLLNLSHPGVVLMSLAAVFAGVAAAVAAAALSHLAYRAADLQQQSDLTI